MVRIRYNYASLKFCLPAVSMVQPTTCSYTKSAGNIPPQLQIPTHMPLLNHQQPVCKLPEQLLLAQCQRIALIPSLPIVGLNPYLQVFLARKQMCERSRRKLYYLGVEARSSHCLSHNPCFATRRNGVSIPLSTCCRTCIGQVSGCPQWLHSTISSNIKFCERPI